jgi:DNA-binding CsgD family transcriptional regulator
VQSSYLAIVATSKGSDLRGVLDVLYELGSPASLEPFPLPMLNRLGALVGAEATQYGEFSLREDGRSYSTDRSIESRGEPDWVSVNWHRLWQQDPISCHLNAGATKPLAISDRVSRRAFQRLEIFQDVYRPFDTADCVRLYLPSPKGTSRFFLFEHGRWGLPQRVRDLLDLLRPHFVRHRQQWRPMSSELACLTVREREILEAVANGDTSPQIATQLCISPHTVRVHLEHIFEKLNVKTRTEAAARLFAARD